MDFQTPRCWPISRWNSLSSDAIARTIGNGGLTKHLWGALNQIVLQVIPCETQNFLKENLELDIFFSRLLFPDAFLT